MGNNTEHTDAQKGYDLIGRVASETQMPEDDMIKFIMNLIKIDRIDPKTLSIEQLREVIINYINRIS